MKTKDCSTTPGRAREAVEAAERILSAGFSVIPIKAGGKEPACSSWKPFMERPPTHDKIVGWFSRQSEPRMGVACGKASGNLEVIDFDHKAFDFKVWAEGVERRRPGLLSRLMIQKTGGGGRHVMYRCEEIDGNAKLTKRRFPAEGHELTEGEDGKTWLTIDGKKYLVKPDTETGELFFTVTTIETRAQGGYIVCAPSKGYEIEQGGWDTVPTIEPDEREVLLEEARALSDAIDVDNGGSGPSVAGNAAEGVQRPGDAFNEQHDSGTATLKLLQDEGWEVERDLGDRYVVRRPGKAEGISGTVFKDRGVFYNFSTNAEPFKAEKGYTKFAVYTMLQHGGDFSAAASALKAQGFGHQHVNGHAADVDLSGIIEKKPAAAPKVEREPFPTDALPMPMRELVEAVADKLGCDPVMPALPALAVAGACIGTTRKVEIDPDWRLFPTIWTVVVSRSGSGKTPAADVVLKPLYQVHKDRAAQYQDKLKEFAREAEQHAKAMKKWERSSADGEPPVAPEPPVQSRMVVSNTTFEALVPILRDNPRGVLLNREEIRGWLKSFGEYKGGLGSDVESWLQMHDSGQIINDRKKDGSMTCDKPFVCIAGGVQPSVLKRALGRDLFENGLAQRLLIAHADDRPMYYNDRPIPPEAKAGWSACLDLLLGMDFAHDTEPVVVPFTPSAKAKWVEFKDDMERRRQHCSDALSGAFSKLQNTAARFALIHHTVNETVGGVIPDGRKPIGVESAQAAVKLARWFAAEAASFYAQTEGAGESPGAAADPVVEWVAKQGGSVEPWRLVQGMRHRFRKTSDAAAALESLVAQGLGEWDYPNGGRKKVFVLAGNRTPSQPTGDAAARDKVSPPDGQ